LTLGAFHERPHNQTANEELQATAGSSFSLEERNMSVQFAPSAESAPKNVPLAERHNITFPETGMVLGTIMMQRSCKLMVDYIDLAEGSLRADLNAFHKDNTGTEALFMKSIGTLQAPSRTGQQAAQKLMHYAEATGSDGLIVVYRTDFTGRTHEGNQSVTDFLSETINDRDMPMVCLLGETPRLRPVHDESDPSQRFLARVATTFRANKDMHISLVDESTRILGRTDAGPLTQTLPAYTMPALELAGMERVGA
jgi:hypothetical protein